MSYYDRMTQFIRIDYYISVPMQNFLYFTCQALITVLTKFCAGTVGGRSSAVSL